MVVRRGVPEGASYSASLKSNHHWTTPYFGDSDRATLQKIYTHHFPGGTYHATNGCFHNLKGHHAFDGFGQPIHKSSARTKILPTVPSDSAHSACADTICRPCFIDTLHSIGDEVLALEPSSVLSASGTVSEYLLLKAKVFARSPPTSLFMPALPNSASSNVTRLLVVDLPRLMVCWRSVGQNVVRTRLDICRTRGHIRLDRQWPEKQML